MRSSQATILLTALLLPLASTTPVGPPPPVCTVPAIGIIGLAEEFTLILQNVAVPELHRQTLSFLPDGDIVKAVVAPEAEVRNLTFTMQDLFVDNRKPEKLQAFLLPAEPGTGLRQLAFKDAPANKLQAFGGYGCDEFGKQQLELTPVGNGLVGWCVAKSKGKESGWNFYVQSNIGSGAECTKVVAVVTDGLRPL